MRAAIFDPYLDTLGGGERYVMTTAKILESNNFIVDIEWPDESIKKKLEERFGFDLSGINFVENIKKGRGYDLVFWLSDGSIPNLSGKNNILHFQVPFRGVGGKSLINRVKLAKVKTIVCNSRFTKRFIDKEYGVNSEVIYPPIDTDNFESSTKENFILNIGRFSQLLQSKRQDVLVEVFKRMVDDGLKGWKLVLAGGTDIGGKEFIEKLKKISKSYSVEIFDSPNFQIIRQLYSKAKFFWSSSGFDIDEEEEPEKVEHFGMSVVEAMSAGCVPIVVRAGGHKEIIEDGYNGFLWESSLALSEKTKELIKDNKKRQWLSKNAQKRAQSFSQTQFENEIKKFIV